MIEKNVVELHANNNDTPKVKSSWVLPVALIVIVEIVLLLPSSLTMEAKWSLFGFCSAIILWTTTTINSAYIALGSVLFLIISGTAKQDLLFDSLASDVIWLMIGSFILGRALQITGLAEKNDVLCCESCSEYIRLMLDFNNDYSNTCLFYSIYIGTRSGCITCFSSYI